MSLVAITLGTGIILTLALIAAFIIDDIRCGAAKRRTRREKRSELALAPRPSGRVPPSGWVESFRTELVELTPQIEEGREVWVRQGAGGPLRRTG